MLGGCDLLGWRQGNRQRGSRAHARAPAGNKAPADETDKDKGAGQPPEATDLARPVPGPRGEWEGQRAEPYTSKNKAISLKQK